jgi:methylated-DNA-protein-cysteine methyltransferase-like protein
MKKKDQKKNKFSIPFFAQVYKIVQEIPFGKVTTYGLIAKALSTRDARRIGHALHANPVEFQIPCHRVVDKTGRLAPNFAFAGWQEQKLRLKSEGITFVDGMHVRLEMHLWHPVQNVNPA